ncbi:MAG: O-antigen ligase family protein [Acidobacteria bacterium]|nr:O-antigen ligase family protein [Acidobacteriota bacterium]
MRKFSTFNGEGLSPGEAGASVLARVKATDLLSALTFLSVLSITFSIAISQIFLAAALVCWLYLRARGRGGAAAIPAMYFLALFAALAVVSAAFSSRPFYSLGYLKKFWIFSLWWIVPVAVSRARQVEKLYCWISVGATLSAGVGIFQYFFDPHISLVNRITGLTGHWMTFAGLQMLSALALLALLLSSRRGTLRWIYPAVPVQIFALALSQTRSALLGLLAGVLVLVWLINRRWILPLAVLALAVYLLLPGDFQERLQASVDLSDSTTRIRLELLTTGWHMIQAHPFFGVGPRMVPIEFAHYRTTNEFPSWIYQHLHNNFVQIGAELGLPALLAWIGILAAVVAGSAGPLARDRLPEERKFAPRAAIACVVALLVAGMFEYNFGDSEVLTLFLFVVGSPFVVFRDNENCLDGNAGNSSALRGI